MALLSLGTDFDISSIPELDTKLPWLWKEIEPSLSSSGPAKSVSTRERKPCPACNGPPSSMRQCHSCSLWMHEECLRKHECPNDAPKRPPPQASVKPSVTAPKPTAPQPAAPMKLIQRLAAERAPSNIYGSVGTDKKPFERATDQNTTASLDGVDIPTISKFKVKADQEAWVALVHSKIQHFSTAPVEEKQAIIWELLNLPKYYCRKFNIPGVAQRARRSFQTQQLQGFVMQSRPPARSNTSAEARRVKRVKQQATDGFRGKATRTAMQEDCEFEHEADVLADLQKLHPEEREHPELCLQSSAKLHDLDPNLVEKTVKQMCHGSAAGRTGWTEELLRPLLVSDCTRRQITSIIEMIINDEVAPEIRDRINAARLIAVPKPPKNQGEKPGTRPITVNETFRKVAQAIVVKSVSTLAAKHFEGLQYGISVEGGAEILCHHIGAGIKQKRILVALDAKNAFNTPWRRAIAAELERNPKFHAIINQWNFCYSRHTNLHYRKGDVDTVIKSQRGTRQGDVLGAFLFALVIHPVLVEAKHLYGNEVDIVAYLDDITLLGNNSKTMKACVELIEKRFNELGIELNAAKCEWFSEKVSCPFTSWQHVRCKPVKILGAFHAPEGAAWDNEVEKCILNHTKAKHSLFFERMKALPSNIALVLLKACGVPRMNYTIRVQEPKLARKACEQFDEKVAEAIEAMACIKLDDESRALLSLPTGMGGCGLTRMAEISPLAYEASKSQNGPKEERLSQDELTTAHYQKVAHALAESSQQMKLHLEDCAGQGNSAWMESVEDVEIIADEVVAACLRLRLNSLHEAHQNQDLIRCPGCSKELHPKETNQHLSGCARIRGRNAAGRHAYLKNATGRICTANGIHHQHKEPQGYEMRVCTICREIFPESLSAAHLESCKSSSTLHIKEAASVRPDKWIELRSEKKNAMIEVVIDVSIVAGTTATNVNGSSSIADGLRERERRKHALYGEAAKLRGEKLMVVAVTPNGSMSEETKEFARMIAKTSDSKGAYSARHAERDIKRAVIIGSGVSLINAEKAAKIYYSPKAVRDVEEIMNAYAEPITTVVEEPEWYELPEDAPLPSAGTANALDASRLSRRNSLLEPKFDRSTPPSPPLEFASSHSTPNASPLEQVLPPHPVSVSHPPLECQHRAPLRPLAEGQPTVSAVRVSSLPAHVDSSFSSAPQDVSVSVGMRNSTTTRDSQKSSSWSLLRGVVALGAAPEGGKK